MVKVERMNLHVEGFDEKLGGGIPLNSVILISGTTGTMKSSLAFNIAYNEVKKNHKIALYISLEETFETLSAQMQHLGFSFKDIDVVQMGYELNDLRKKKSKIFKNKDKGGLIISDLGQVRKELADKELAPNENWFLLTKSLIKEVKTQVGLDIVVIDSMSALHALSQIQNPRVRLFYFFEFLRDLKITSFLITESSYDNTKLSTFDEEIYLADGIIKLAMTNRHRKVSREISIVKLRIANATTDIFTLEFKNGKFVAMYGGQTPLI